MSSDHHPNSHLKNGDRSRKEKDNGSPNAWKYPTTANSSLDLFLSTTGTSYHLTNEISEHSDDISLDATLAAINPVAMKEKSIQNTIATTTISVTPDRTHTKQMVPHQPDEARGEDEIEDNDKNENESTVVQLLDDVAPILPPNDSFYDVSSVDSDETDDCTTKEFANTILDRIDGSLEHDEQNREETNINQEGPTVENDKEVARLVDLCACKDDDDNTNHLEPNMEKSDGGSIHSVEVVVEPLFAIVDIKSEENDEQCTAIEIVQSIPATNIDDNDVEEEEEKEDEKLDKNNMKESQPEAETQDSVSESHNLFNAKAEECVVDTVQIREKFQTDIATPVDNYKEIYTANIIRDESDTLKTSVEGALGVAAIDNKEKVSPSGIEDSDTILSIVEIVGVKGNNIQDGSPTDCEESEKNVTDVEIADVPIENSNDAPPSAFNGNDKSFTVVEISGEPVKNSREATFSDVQENGDKFAELEIVGTPVKNSEDVSPSDIEGNIQSCRAQDAAGSTIHPNTNDEVEMKETRLEAEHIEINQVLSDDGGDDSDKAKDDKEKVLNKEASITSTASAGKDFVNKEMIAKAVSEAAVSTLDTCTTTSPIPLIAPINAENENEDTNLENFTSPLHTDDVQAATAEEIHMKTLSSENDGECVAVEISGVSVENSEKASPSEIENTNEKCSSVEITGVPVENGEHVTSSNTVKEKDEICTAAKAQDDVVEKVLNNEISTTSIAAADTAQVDLKNEEMIAKAVSVSEVAESALNTRTNEDGVPNFETVDPLLLADVQAVTAEEIPMKGVSDVMESKPTDDGTEHVDVSDDTRHAENKESDTSKAMAVEELPSVSIIANVGPIPETSKQSPVCLGQALVKPLEAADDESTLASTFTGTGFCGPVSYVEFSSKGAHDDSTNRGATSAAGIPAQKKKVIHHPSDSCLTDIPKLIIADMWRDDQTYVVATLDRMSALCNLPANIAALLTHGGHASLVLLLRKWSHDPEIQAAGLETLHQAAESLDFCNAVVELGALELVIVAMRNHTNHVDVQTAACGALLNLTLPAPNARQLVHDYDGISAVGRACASFPNNVKLQKYALWLIQYMSYWDDFKAPIVKAGGLQILTKIVETFSTHERTKNIDTLLKSARATVQRLL